MGLLKEMWDTAQLVKKLRKAGVDCKLALVDEAELIDSRSWLFQRDKENKLMQECIISFAEGKSPCDYCEERAKNACSIAVPMPRGCKDWWLRFLTDEEMDAVRERVERGDLIGSPDSGIPRPVSDCTADQESDVGA